MVKKPDPLCKKLLPINTEDSPDQMAIWEHLATAEGYDRISMNGTS